MKEAAERAAGIIASLRADRDNWKRLCMSLIAAAGGTIKVPLSVMVNPPDQLTTWEDVENGGRIYTTERKQ